MVNTEASASCGEKLKLLLSDLQKDAEISLNLQSLGHFTRNSDGAESEESRDVLIFV